MLPCLPSAPLLLRHSALKCCPVCLPPLFATALCPKAALLSVPFLQKQKCPSCLAVVRSLSAKAEMPLLPYSCLPSVPTKLALCPWLSLLLPPIPIILALCPRLSLLLPPIPIILALCPRLALLMLATHPHLQRHTALPCPRWGGACEMRCTTYHPISVVLLSCVVLVVS